MAASVSAVTALTVIAASGSVLYLLPLLIGLARHAPDLAAIAVINIALGWTLAGWVIALAMAVRTVERPQPPVQVVQNISPVPQLPPPGGGWILPSGEPPADGPWPGDPGGQR
ncbi:MAG TPA: superinfection immunity protein [Streptosporangiaceae bacterium]|jgi:hypothetical protein